MVCGGVSGSPAGVPAREAAAGVAARPDGADEPRAKGATTTTEGAATATEASADAAIATAVAAEAAAASARHSDRVIEVIAVILLGAGSPFWRPGPAIRPPRWNIVQAADYVRGSGLRVESAKASTQAGQDRLYDSQVFSQWLNAYDAGNSRLAAIYERRFRQEFRVAFQAWLETDPFNDPNAPPGPLFMTEYVDASAVTADRPRGPSHHRHPGRTGRQ